MSKLQVDDIVNKEDTGSPGFSKGVVVTGNVTVGVADTGHDVKLFGATSGAYCLWDEDVDDLILAGDAGLIVPDGQFTLGSTAVTSSAADLNLVDGIVAGTVTASKAVIVDGSKNITGFNTITTTGTLEDSKGDVRSIPLRAVTGSQVTLVLTDAGKVVSTDTTGWIVPALSWTAGDTVTLLNNSGGGLTIDCSAVTTYLTSDGTTATSKTLGARGMATLYFTTSSACYLQGTSLS